MAVNVVKLLLLAVIFLSGCTASHHDIFPELSDPELRSKAIAPARLREDVDALIAGITARHPDVSRYADIVSIHKAAAALKAELTEPMTRQAFFKKIGALSHLFNDGHTFLLWPYQEYDALAEQGIQTFPLGLEVYSEGVFLKHAYQHNDITLPKGSQLVSINNIAVGDIFAKAQQYVGGETEILRKHTVAGRFPMMLWAVFGFAGQFELELSVAGNAQQVTINGNDNWQRVSSQTAGENTDFAYRRLNSNTGYLKVASFDVSPDWFETFIDDTFLKISKQNVETLIIDIRENMGGNTDTASYLAQHLAAAPFRMVSSLQERLNADNRGLFNYRGDEGEVLTQDWDEWLAPADAERRFNGRAYVLISPMSYSSAIVFATAVKDNAMATLVGRKTGGYANQTAQGNLFNLPNSELRVYVATRLLVRPGGDLRVDGVIPDIHIETTNAQIEAGEDADILAVLQDAALPQQ